MRSGRTGTQSRRKGNYCGNQTPSIVSFFNISQCPSSSPLCLPSLQLKRPSPPLPRSSSAPRPSAPLSFHYFPPPSLILLPIYFPLLYLYYALSLYLSSLCFSCLLPLNPLPVNPPQRPALWSETLCFTLVPLWLRPHSFAGTNDHIRQMTIITVLSGM